MPHQDEMLSKIGECLSFLKSKLLLMGYMSVSLETRWSACGWERSQSP